MAHNINTVINILIVSETTSMYGKGVTVKVPNSCAARHVRVV